jgi:hypothetical protein
MSVSTNRSKTCKAGKEYGRKQGKLIEQNLIKQVMRLPVLLSTYVTLA